MAKTKKKSRITRAYLTKRRLASAARTGIRIAAANTMDVMGYTVVAYRGWVVKKFADGRIEKIEPLANPNKEKNANISLD